MPSQALRSQTPTTIDLSLGIPVAQDDKTYITSEQFKCCLNARFKYCMKNSGGAARLGRQEKGNTGRTINYSLN